LLAYGRADRCRRYSGLPVSFRRAGLSVCRCSFLVPLAYGPQPVSRGAPSQAMSAECERVFSSTKKLLTTERCWLAPDIIEASECLKTWWDRGLIQQLEDEQEIGDGSGGNKDRFCILHSQFYVLIY
jgi:hypothetical protein